MQTTQNNSNNHAQTTATKAIKITLISCVIVIIFAALSLWILLNQITATANLVKKQKEYEIRLEKLEENLKPSTKE
ncbi:DUF5408 family protein [Helicobacter sp. MIT 05-5294]|uniref:DUF5408 family protein n=1 Tax=Helicobacter sp. MIT 05-5294 TaxID=1548150 RepID=UPI00051FC81F|nr:DUF5408 family protein [Helicobacter sp. MIT 05-5294]TLD87858.1 hypothetical protein LS69_003465 [Helicobacter sp. MIT 05-5294]